VENVIRIQMAEFDSLALFSNADTGPDDPRAGALLRPKSCPAAGDRKP
jgi:hypothetical protein